MNALANSQVERAREVPRAAATRTGNAPVTLRPLHRPGDDEERAGDHRQPARHPADQLRDARADPHAAARAARWSRPPTDLRFLVLDELHTYRGRQGADVAHARAPGARAALDSGHLQCVGTSATLAGRRRLRRAAAARSPPSPRSSSATRSSPDSVIGETLRRATPRATTPTTRTSSSELRRCVAARRTVRSRATTTSSSATRSSCWIETTFGVAEREDRRRVGRARCERSRCTARHRRCRDGDRRARAAPRATWRELTGLRRGRLRRRDRAHAARGRGVRAQAGHERPGRSPSGCISSSAAATRSTPPSSRRTERHITVSGPAVRAGWRRAARPAARRLLPRVRSGVLHGAALEPTRRARRAGDVRAAPARPTHRRGGRASPASSTSATTVPWPDDADEAIAKLPDDWLERLVDGRQRVRARPREVRCRSRSASMRRTATERRTALSAHYMPAPFRFCLQLRRRLRVRAAVRLRQARHRSAPEGRSTATTVLSLGDRAQPAGGRRPQPDGAQAAQLHRQPAGRLAAGRATSTTSSRSACCAPRSISAVERRRRRGPRLRRAHAARLRRARICRSSTTPATPRSASGAPETPSGALRNVLGYRLYRDLQRGWRVTSPNLEQCGLLRRSTTRSLDELCAAEDECGRTRTRRSARRAPRDARHGRRVLLDFMRRELAIKVDYLDPDDQEQHPAAEQPAPRRAVGDRRERAAGARGRSLFPRPRGAATTTAATSTSRRAAASAQYLRRPATFPDCTAIKIADGLGADHRRPARSAARVGGLVEWSMEPREDDDVAGLPAAGRGACAGWPATARSRIHDPIRVPQPAGGRQPAHQPVLRRVLPARSAAECQGLEAREHTAQVPSRTARSARRRSATADLPVLYCSPTMELGVDIAELNVVNMRNVPPTPANYAQRSGRAGRSGQPALVFTYCATGSPHDQYFFQRPERHGRRRGHAAAPRPGQRGPACAPTCRRSGSRSRASTWAARCATSSTSRATPPTLELQPHVVDDAGQRAAASSAPSSAPRPCSQRSASELDRGALVRRRAGSSDVFARARARVRRARASAGASLYRAAYEPAERAARDHRSTPSRDAEDERSAPKRCAREARGAARAAARRATALDAVRLLQLPLLRQRGLPARLQLPAPAAVGVHPGAPATTGRDEFLSRPRFLAISEFGPRRVIYHEGSRYVINKVILPVEATRRAADHDGSSSARRAATCIRVERRARPGPLRAAAARRCPRAMHHLFRLQNVATRRRERITSDEEERLRLGYEIVTGVRFARARRAAAAAAGRGRCRTGSRSRALTYGHSATLWRINMGWRRRTNPDRARLRARRGARLLGEERAGEGVRPGRPDVGAQASA